MSKVWVTRDKVGAHNSSVEIWESKPIKNDGIFTSNGGKQLAVVWHPKKTFGFTPKKGSCKQMELSLTEIE